MRFGGGVGAPRSVGAVRSAGKPGGSKGGGTQAGCRLALLKSRLAVFLHFWGTLPNAFSISCGSQLRAPGTATAGLITEQPCHSAHFSPFHLQSFWLGSQCAESVPTVQMGKPRLGQEMSPYNFTMGSLNRLVTQPASSQPLVFQTADGGSGTSGP